MRILRFLALFLVALAAAPMPAAAQAPKPFTQAELDQMLAPIALFPDALLAQALMAATYPSDVAQAVDWAYANRNLEGDAAVRAAQDKPWDPSVQSLVAFPKVLAMFGENPKWVQDMGDAFLDQPEAVMDSVQFLRSKAQAAGNLATDEHQVVAVEAAPPPPATVVVNAPPPPTQIITIVPANPQVVFVPIYNPVWAFGPWWHPAFPPFFFPPPPRWGWGWSSAAHAGFWWGVGFGVSYALWGGVNWRTRNVNINVNQWNSINVNRRIDSRDRNVDWRHDPRNRRGVPYRDPGTRERMRPLPGDVRSRDDYRGRDVQRDRAREELAGRVGSQNLDRDAIRDVDRNIRPQQRPDVGNAAGGARDRAGNVDRSQVQNRAQNVDRSQAQQRVQSVDRSQVQNRAPQNRAPQVSRAEAQNRANQVNRDNALRGASNPQQVRQQIDRGNVSRESMQQQARQGGVDRNAAAAAAASRRR